MAPHRLVISTGPASEALGTHLEDCDRTAPTPRTALAEEVYLVSGRWSGGPFVDLLKEMLDMCIQLSSIAVILNWLKGTWASVKGETAKD